MISIATPLTLILAYAFSYLGCLVGLIATARARRSSKGSRGRWLVMGAFAIGGTGIWVMHFMAIIGVQVPGSEIRFDVSITAASFLLAVLAVGVGLFIVGYGDRPGAVRVIAAGALTGTSVAGMHYTGVAGMRMDATVHYNVVRVVLSVVIAVVAATVALWFTVTLSRARWIAVAAAIMGVAVTGMHYTGMSAMQVHLLTTPKALHGISALDFVPPILVFVLLGSIVLAYALLIEPANDERPPAPPTTPGRDGAGFAGSLPDRRDHVIFPTQRPTSGASGSLFDPLARHNQPPTHRPR
ncbi:MHYT domain-containing protein [Rugosimonospora acidiphila]|uniref:MHYT domain-containing protein n=1 Tax=Rugosimonospora acidiphila TaxID=556531 RepID=A0ABP9SKU7_9ACTN